MDLRFLGINGGTILSHVLKRINEIETVPGNKGVLDGEMIERIQQNLRDFISSSTVQKISLASLLFVNPASVSPYINIFFNEFDLNPQPLWLSYVKTLDIVTLFKIVNDFMEAIKDEDKRISRMPKCLTITLNDVYFQNEDELNFMRFMFERFENILVKNNAEIILVIYISNKRNNPEIVDKLSKLFEARSQNIKVSIYNESELGSAAIRLARVPLKTES